MFSKFSKYHLVPPTTQCVRREQASVHLAVMRCCVLCFVVSNSGSVEMNDMCPG